MKHERNRADEQRERLRERYWPDSATEVWTGPEEKAHQLGKFVAFDVNDFDRELPGRAVPADARLASGGHEKMKRAQKHLVDGAAALKKKNASAALTEAESAEQLNPGFYQNATLRGRALLALQRREEAAEAFKTALGRQPAFLAERQQLEALLKQARETK